MMSPDHLFGILCAHPFPGTTDLRMSSGACCFTAEHIALGYTHNGWISFGREIPDEMPHPSVIDAAQVHAEIHRVLAIVKSEEDRRRDLEAQLAKITAERDALIIAESTLSKIAAALAIPALEPHDDALNMVKRLVDAHAVVSRRLIGSQKEVAEVSAERDESTARADKIEDRLRRDDELREQIAVAVGLDGSASLALIFDTVTRDRPAREIARLSGLLDVLAAPVAFGERRLSTVERAEWALRRALRERDECAPRMAQLIDAEVLLDVLGVPAYAAVPGDDPGDASEALTVAERLRLYFGAHKDP